MKIICIDGNYKNNLARPGQPEASQLVIFMKPDSSILKKNKPFFLPDFAEEFWCSVHIILKISKLGKGISEKFAHRYYDEFTAGIDITAGDSRNYYQPSGLPWDLSKGFDGAAPLGEFIPVSSVENINNVNFKLTVNGNTVQETNTSEMIYPANKIIEHVSRFCTLKTGDLIFTGTPAGSSTLNIHDRLIAYINNQPILDFYVR